MSDLISNKKAYFNYEILDRYEAGVVLTGHEVKSVRSGKASLTGAYVIVRGKEAFLVHASISPYQVANTPKQYDPARVRKLLLSRKEIAELARGTEELGLTIVALKWYNQKTHLKLEIALARGKKKADKRETIKARDSARDVARELSPY
jgi:SsrA-binding protein